MPKPRKFLERFPTTANGERDRPERLGRHRTRAPNPPRPPPGRKDSSRDDHLGARALLRRGDRVLRRHEINGRFAPARIQVALDRLLTASVRRVEVKPLVTEAWQLRRTLTLADALYVVVAQHLQALLVTTDAHLARSPGLPVATLTP